MIALDVLFRSYTRDEVLESMLTVADTVGLKARSWRSGSIGRTILVIIASAIAFFTQFQGIIARGGLLDYATESWLTLLAKSLYRVYRIEATYATGDVTLTNSSGIAVGPFDIGDITVFNSVTGKTYKVQAVVSLGASSSADYPVLADEAGSASDAGPGTIELASPWIGGSATNALSILGNDEETDENLRTRCREKLGSLSPNGPAEAYSYVIKSQEYSPTSVPITRTKVEISTGDGTVDIYAATASGTPSGGDLAIAQTAVDTYAEPQCVIATVYGATPLAFAPYVTIYVRNDNRSDSQILNAASTAIGAYLASLPIGGLITSSPPGRVDLDGVKFAIRDTSPSTVVDIDITFPTSDPVVAAHEVPIFTGAIFTLVRV